MHYRSPWAAVAFAAVLCAGCASAPEQQAEYQAPKVYRTGSNIPTKDYGAVSDVKTLDPKVFEDARRKLSPKPGLGGT